MKVLWILACVFTLPAFAASPVANELPWDEYIRDAGPAASAKLLATLHVGTRQTELTLPVARCAEDIRAVELKVSGADVNVKSFGIRFSDGNTREFKVGADFKNGTDSGWVDLDLLHKMDPRCPTAVFASGSANGVAVVRVYGDMK